MMHLTCPRVPMETHRREAEMLFDAEPELMHFIPGSERMMHLTCPMVPVRTHRRKAEMLFYTRHSW